MSKPRFRLTTIAQCKEGDCVYLIQGKGRTKPITIAGRGVRSASYFYGFRAPGKLVPFVTTFPAPNYRKVWKEVR